jgi:hypothetical protein
VLPGLIYVIGTCAARANICYRVLFCQGCVLPGLMCVVGSRAARDDVGKEHCPVLQIELHQAPVLSGVLIIES